MSLSFLDSVNAELKRRHPGLVTTIGWKARSAHNSPPCVRWIADAAALGDAALRADRLTQSLAGRVLRYKVECWGRDLDETQRLVKSVWRVALRLGTRGTVDPQGEEWEGLEGSGGAILGEMATLTMGVRDDIEDDDETTVAPPTTTTVGGGYA